jgi:hypothetical protein
MRRLSHVLLTIEAIALVFPTFLGGVFIVGAGENIWTDLWARGQAGGALWWSIMLLALVAAWWLLLAYFYVGPQGARRVPLVVWLFAALVALLSLLEAAVGGENSPLYGLAPCVLFVPTFLHLVGEVWLWPRSASLERVRET